MRVDNPMAVCDGSAPAHDGARIVRDDEVDSA
jgi:hypothetical protein